jgi:hypothetical protein
VLRHHEGLRKHNRSRKNCNGNITSSIESLHDSCSSSIATSCCIVLCNKILRPKKPSEKRKKDSVLVAGGGCSILDTINSKRARRCIARQSVHLLARWPHVIDGGDGRRCRSDLDDYRVLLIGLPHTHTPYTSNHRCFSTLYFLQATGYLCTRPWISS